MSTGETDDLVASTASGTEEAPFEVSPDQEAALRAIAKLHNIPLESFARVLRFESAGEFLAVLHSYPLKEQRWAFRGHADIDWNLEPSIERLQRLYSNSFRIDAETYIRKAFRRRAHHFLQSVPGELEELEWMALMRHHGAPTRLLDWTRSPYVAAFFALADAKEDGVSSIWAIDIDAIKAEAIQLLSENCVIENPKGAPFSFSDRTVFDRVFLQKTKPSIVAPVQPLRMNERATSQQSLFLCPNNSIHGFEFGLKQVLKSEKDRIAASGNRNPDGEIFEPERLFKLNIAPQARNDLLRELHRMNINYATLFPGLDGFSRSLGTNVTVSGFAYDLFGDDLDSIV